MLKNDDVQMMKEALALAARLDCSSISTASLSFDKAAGMASPVRGNYS